VVSIFVLRRSKVAAIARVSFAASNGNCAARV
jgi:hypothetical protein